MQQCNQAVANSDQDAEILERKLEEERRLTIGRALVVLRVIQRRSSWLTFSRELVVAYRRRVSGCGLWPCGSLFNYLDSQVAATKTVCSSGRLFYVALTRARNELLLSFSLHHANGEAGASHTMLYSHI